MTDARRWATRALVTTLATMALVACGSSADGASGSASSSSSGSPGPTGPTGTAVPYEPAPGSTKALATTGFDAAAAVKGFERWHATATAAPRSAAPCPMFDAPTAQAALKADATFGGGRALEVTFGTVDPAGPLVAPFSGPTISCTVRSGTSSLVLVSLTQAPVEVTDKARVAQDSAQAPDQVRVFGHYAVTVGAAYGGQQTYALESTLVDSLATLLQQRLTA